MSNNHESAKICLFNRAIVSSSRILILEASREHIIHVRVFRANFVLRIIVKETALTRVHATSGRGKEETP